MFLSFLLVLSLESIQISTHAARLVRPLAARHGNLSLAADGANLASSTGTVLTNPSASPSRTRVTTAPNTDDDHSSRETLPDQCWASWASYWRETSAIETRLTTLTFTDTSINPTVLSFFTVPMATLIIEGNGNFALKTLTTTIPRETYANSVTHLTSVRTGTFVTHLSPTITTPPCVLPTYMTQCQSSWISWADHGAYPYHAPPCTQANITGSACSAARSNWLSQARYSAGEHSGKVGLQIVPQMSNGTTMFPTDPIQYTWPTSSPIAPGCTVGCQSCALSGNSVQILYWPPATTGWRNGTFFATTSEPTSPVTMVAHGTTFTSPTVYISFDRLHASNSCHDVGKTLQNVIVPITNSATLSSLYGWDRYWGLQGTASFNFTDLYVSPVPNSIYASQPRCASSQINILYNTCIPYGAKGGPICAEMAAGTWSCPRSLPYQPVISIPAEVLQLQPDWSSCTGGVIGVYDPPSALHPANSVQRPTAPTAVFSALALPTEHSDVVPTTPASPSPTHTGPASQTQSSTVKSPIQTKSTAPSSLNEPASAHTNLPPASSPESTDNDSDIASSPTLPVEETPSYQQRPNPSTSQSSLLESTQNIPASPIDALQVLTQALADPPFSEGSPPSASHREPSPTNIGPEEPSSHVLGGPSEHDPGATSSESGSIATPAATWSAGGETISALQEGSNIIVANEQSTATLPASSTAVFAGQTIVPAEIGNLEIGESSIQLSPSVASQAIWTVQDDTFSVQSQGSNILIAGPSQTAVLTSDNDVVTLDHQTIRMSDNTLLINNTPMPTPSPTASAYSIPTQTTWQNQHKTITAYADHDATTAFIYNHHTTIWMTVPPNHQPATTTFASETLTLLPDGRTLIISASTLILPIETPHILISASSSVLLAADFETATLTAGGPSFLIENFYSEPKTGGPVIVYPLTGGGPIATVEVPDNVPTAFPSKLPKVKTEGVTGSRKNGDGEDGDAASKTKVEITYSNLVVGTTTSSAGSSATSTSGARRIFVANDVVVLLPVVVLTALMAGFNL